MVIPSARAAKESAMRWRSTGAASAITSSSEGLSRPSMRARARQASISAWLARGPGPHELRLDIGIGDVDLEEEAVELRLGERVGAFLLERVLRRQHVEGPRQRMVLAGDRDAAFLHRLEQRRLRARAGAVDLVRHQELAED